MLDTVVISGEDVCFSVSFWHSGWCVSVMWYELLMASAICCPLWSSVYECLKVVCAFTSQMRTECGMFVMCCAVLFCMSVSAVL